MVEISVSNAAETDLEDIDEYTFQQFGEAAASEYSFGFQQAFDLLLKHPLAGRPEPGLGKGLHCLTHEQHRIFYRVEDDLVLIVRIVHHAQDEKRALNE